MKKKKSTKRSTKKKIVKKVAKRKTKRHSFGSLRFNSAPERAYIEIDLNGQHYMKLSNFLSYAKIDDDESWQIRRTLLPITNEHGGKISALDLRRIVTDPTVFTTGGKDTHNAILISRALDILNKSGKKVKYFTNIFTLPQPSMPIATNQGPYFQRPIRRK